MAQVTLSAQGAQMTSIAAFFLGAGARGGIGATDATQFGYRVEAGVFTLVGTGLGSYVAGLPTQGAITGLTYTPTTGGAVAITGLDLAAGSFSTFVTNNQSLELLAALTAGADTMTGSAGADDFVVGGGANVVNGGGGIDTVDFIDRTDGMQVNLAATGAQAIGGGATLTLTSIENLTGGGGADVLTGDGGDNFLRGRDGADQLNGGAGADILSGEGGNDVIDGGAGQDTAFFIASAVNFAVHPQLDGSYVVQDGRASSPLGSDTVRNVESFVFGDLTVAAGAATQPAVTVAFSQLLRTGTTGANAALAADLSFRLASSLITPAAAVAEVVKAADATTSVATMAYEFFTGKTPSAAGLDYLVSPTGPNANNLNSAYYQGFSIENRNINFAVNLGKLGEGKDAFAAKYGQMNLHDATKAAYTTIFGAAPGEAKLDALLGGSFVLNGQTMTRADYFAYYGQDGANGIGTKAAMVGWLLAEAEKADLGTYARSNAAYLTDLADGGNHAVDIVGVYGKPEYVFGG